MENAFRKVFKRENLLLNSIFSLFLLISSYPRLVIEAFTRRIMGCRYFSRASVITVTVLLCMIPIMIAKVAYGSGGMSLSRFFSNYATWYIFVVLFIACADRRDRENYNKPNILDIDLFTLAPGSSAPFFYSFPFLKQRPSNYTVEVYLEPAVFFIVGLLLAAWAQPIGLLLMWCSIVHSISHAAQYKLTLEQLQDARDSEIVNRELANVLIHDLPPNKTQGVRMDYKPSSSQKRRQIVNHYLGIDNDDETHLEVS